MPDAIAELATAIWEGAYRLADEAAAAERRASAEKIKALETERDDRENEVSLVEDERDAALTRAEAAETRLTEQVRRNVELEVRAASLEGRLQGRIEAAKEGGKGASVEIVGNLAGIRGLGRPTRTTQRMTRTRRVEAALPVGSSLSRPRKTIPAPQARAFVSLGVSSSCP